jgi:hypothetical protein
MRPFPFSTMPGARGASDGAPGQRTLPGAKAAGQGRDSAQPLRLDLGRRVQRVPHLMVGVLLVVGCSLAFFVWSLRADGSIPVLVLARDVAAGQVLTEADVAVVQMAGNGVAAVPAAELHQVLGQPIAVPRPAGALLAPGDVGRSRFPPAGKAVVAVAVKAGQFPPGLAVGVRVAVLITASAGGSAGAGGSVGAASAPPRTGLVVAVQPDAAGAAGPSVVSVLVEEAEGMAVGAAPVGAVSLVQLSPAGAERG